MPDAYSQHVDNLVNAEQRLLPARIKRECGNHPDGSCDVTLERDIT